MKVFLQTLMISFTLVSANSYAAATLSMKCKGNPELVLPLLSDSQAEASHNSNAAIINLGGNQYYVEQAILGKKQLKLDSATYCGGFFSSSPCPSDVYERGGSKLSSNLMFEFVNSSDSVFLTINSKLEEMNSPKFTAKVSGRDGEVRKVTCEVK